MGCSPLQKQNGIYDQIIYTLDSRDIETFDKVNISLNKGHGE